jgi:hypothetical protein
MRHSTRAALDNRSRQLNPQDARYAQSRGVTSPPTTAASVEPEPSNPHCTVKPDSAQKER